MVRLGIIALGFVATGAGPAAHRRTPKRQHKASAIARAPVRPSAHVSTPSAFSQLELLRIYNINTRKHLTARLYDALGRIDGDVASKLDKILCDSRDPDNVKTTTINRRTLQLVYRAAYHFHASKIEVVSAYRESKGRRQGMHAQGRAIDFKMPGVDSPALAAYLRTIPRLGVGIYTHPKTRFVHLDVRDRSFHWLDASPPHRHWRERNISSKTLAALDAKYSPSWDWPEGLTPPQSNR